MKTLFFVLSTLVACGPSKVEISEGVVKKDNHTGLQPDFLEPVGVIPGEDCQQIDRGDMACNFRLTDQNGDTWDLYSHAGKVILLDFSTAWCYPCQMAGHYTQTIQNDYEAEGFEFVTVLIDGANSGYEPTEAEITQWVTEHNVTTAPVLQGSRDKMIDSTGVGVEGYLLGAFPTYIYIDRDMKFYSAHVGFSEEYVREQIEEGL